MAGYIGPFSDHGIEYTRLIQIIPAVGFTWLFCGIFGGFIALALFGAIATTVAIRLPEEIWRFTPSFHIFNIKNLFPKLH